MTENERFHLLMKHKNWDYKDLARITGLKYGTVANALTPGKKTIPPWARVALHIWWEQKD